MNKDQKENIMYNSFSSALAIIDNSKDELLSKVNKYNTNKISAEDKKEVEEMAKNGFLVEENLDEDGLIEVMENKARYEPKVLYLTILPTMNCNMECFYCFEEKYNSSMSIETAEKLTHFIKDSLKREKYEGIHIGWFGGEPLLKVDVIEYISKDVIKFCYENNIKYYSDIVTNGTLFDKENIKSLVNECKIQLAQITIDGVNETNNKRRKLKNNQKSFELIVKNIDMLRGNMKISLRINIDKNNVTEISKIVDFIREKGWDNDENIVVRLAPVINTDNDCNMKKSCLTNKEFFDVDIKMYEETNWLPKYPRFSPMNCAASGLGCYTVDPDGYLYKCLQLPNKEHLNNVGKIGETIQYKSEMIKWLTQKYRENCSECNILPICKGGCPLHMMKGVDFDCESYKEYVKNKLIIFSDKYVKAIGT